MKYIVKYTAEVIFTVDADDVDSAGIEGDKLLEGLTGADFREAVFMCDIDELTEYFEVL
jgi:hypothetical protein